MRRNKILALTGFVALFGSQAVIADDTQEPESTNRQQTEEMTDSNQSPNTETPMLDKASERAPYLTTIETEEDTETLGPNPLIGLGQYLTTIETEEDKEENEKQ